MQSNIIRCLSFFFFSIIRNFRNFREIFASLRRYKFYYCLGMDEWGRVLNYFRGGIFLLISGIHRGEWGGSSNKNCSFRGEVGSFDEKSSFQDKHGPSLNRAHGWLCRSSLFSFFRDLPANVRLIYLSESTLATFELSRSNVFFSIPTVLRPTEFFPSFFFFFFA